MVSRRCGGDPSPRRARPLLRKAQPPHRKFCAASLLSCGIQIKGVGRVERRSHAPFSWARTSLGHSEAVAQSGKEPGLWLPGESRVCHSAV